MGRRNGYETKRIAGAEKTGEIYTTFDATTKTIEENYIVRLSMDGQMDFAEALLNPPEPSAALQQAYENHKKLFGKTH